MKVNYDLMFFNTNLKVKSNSIRILINRKYGLKQVVTTSIFMLIYFLNFRNGDECAMGFSGDKADINIKVFKYWPKMLIQELLLIINFGYDILKRFGFGFGKQYVNTSYLKIK